MMYVRLLSLLAMLLILGVLFSWWIPVVALAVVLLPLAFCFIPPLTRAGIYLEARWPKAWTVFVLPLMLACTYVFMDEGDWSLFKESLGASWRGEGAAFKDAFGND